MDGCYPHTIASKCLHWCSRHTCR